LPLAIQTHDPGLLIRAREQGEPDVFSGKRGWVRHELGMVVEVSTDPTRKPASWRATMHNISGGGIGIWSKLDLPVGSLIHVRDCAEGDKPVWLTGRVSHSTLGLRGYLVGIAFQEQTSPDASVIAARAGGAAEPRQRRAAYRSVAGLQSWRVKCAAGGALACGAVIVIGHAVYDPLAALIGPRAAGAAELAAALLFGALCGWFLVRRELGFVGALHTALRELATGKPPSSPPVEPPSTELAALGRALNDLGARWRKREHDEQAQRERFEEITRIKSNILTVVSHDLRTPLTSILLYAQMLQDELESLADEDKRSFIGIICDECTRLSRLVDDLLEVQRLEAERVRFDLKPCDLGPTIHSCVRVHDPLASRKSMTLTVDCPESLPLVAADSDKIAQAVNNLLSNALKYTPSGGRVVVSAETRDQEILICVADNGPGIPREKWDQIFDRFTQLADPNVCEIAGFGLGLNIVRRIVEAHGGKTWVDSEIGKGSAFYVSLPIEGAKVKEEEPEDTPPAACRVVVCDADPELAALIAQTLRAESCDVRIVHTGQQLQQQLEYGGVDVVVTDVMLPDMDASELLDALNSVTNRSFRTIIHSYGGDAQKLKRRGVDIFLKRPVSKADLIRAIRVAMQKRSAAGLSVVLVESGNLDTGRLRSLLVDAGHMTMMAENLKEAATLVRDYGGDVVVVSNRSLTSAWDDLEDLGLEATDQVGVMVLCDSLRRRERQLEAEHGVTAVAYLPGQEEAIVDVMMESESEVSGSPVL
jgi:signal transduction histidine kinase/DNA-binding response OmpR family regulator